MDKLNEESINWLKFYGGIIEEGIPPSTYYKLVRKSDDKIVAQGSKAKMRKLQKEKGDDDYYIGQSPTKKVGDTYRTKVEESSVSWHRSPRTKQEKKHGAAEEEDTPKVRAKRNPKNLPSTYDDISKSREKSWKKHRKSQYKEEFSLLGELEDLNLLKDLVESVGKPPYNFDHRAEYDYGDHD